MAIIKQTNKTTGITYVYESKSYWDPEKQQARSKRKLIGKIDPATGDIVPTGREAPRKRAGLTQRPRKDSQPNLPDLKRKIQIRRFRSLIFRSR